MSSLQWSDALALDLPLMDDTHREFVDLLARVEAASDATLLEAWRELIAHTDDHFGREDEWMKNTQFASSNCHSMQHEVVLSVMREGAQHGEGGDLASVRQMASELGNWFPQHAQSMDAALALHLRRVGYDPLTGIVSAPQALPQTEIHGCGGSCSTSEADAVDAASTPRSAKPALVSTW
jgi:hemerythrin-like metal-binding protein